MGLAMGDALGAPFEGGLIERLLWAVIGKTKGGRYRYTDDTQMSIDLAFSYLEFNRIDQDHLAEMFAKSYRWSRGYGSSATSLLKKIRNGAKWNEVNRAKFKEGSHGNGAAMRAPIVAMLYSDNETKLESNIIKVSEITHTHPLGIEGAQLVAYVTSCMLNDKSLEIVLEQLPRKCHSNKYLKKVNDCINLLRLGTECESSIIKNKLGNGIAAQDSCITAIYYGLAYKNKNICSMIKQICELGGDADTIGAMAGAIWGASNGELALGSIIEQIENFEHILKLAEKLYLVSTNVAEGNNIM